VPGLFQAEENPMHVIMEQNHELKTLQVKYNDNLNKFKTIAIFVNYALTKTQKWKEVVLELSMSMVRRV